MQGYMGGNAAEQYLVQRIQGASTEQLAALLLEGAQKFLNMAMLAIRNRDVPAKARSVNRVSAIIEELMVWLNPDGTEELSGNLARVYDWWLHELFEGSQGNELERLERVNRQMGEIRQAWEELHRKRTSSAATGNRQSTEGLVG